MKIPTLFKYLTLYFASVVIERAVKSWHPEWAAWAGSLQTVVLVWVAYKILSALGRTKTAAELALEEAEEQAEAQRRAREQLGIEAYELEQEERRQRRNARQREIRAEKRAAKNRPKETKAAPPPKTPPVNRGPKSRWDRLLNDDEE